MFSGIAVILLLTSLLPFTNPRLLEIVEEGITVIGEVVHDEFKCLDDI